MTSKRNSWIMTQTWEHLLFAHWPAPFETVRRLVPEELEVDTFEGQAWIGIIPFQMSGIKLRYLPVIPCTAFFPEVNVRTYVIGNDEPGVFFITLDAGNPLAINIAKLWYHLPYHSAAMSLELQDSMVHFCSERKQTGQTARFRGRYRPVSVHFTAKAGTLEHWLTERYRFYCRCPRDLRIYQGDIDHEPWKLQKAQVEIELNTLTDQLGLNLPAADPPLVHYSRGVTSRIWPVRRFAVRE